MEKPLFFKTNSDGKIILTKIFLYNLKSSVPFYIIFDIKHDKNLIMVLKFLTFERKIMCMIVLYRIFFTTLKNHFVNHIFNFIFDIFQYGNFRVMGVCQ